MQETWVWSLGQGDPLEKEMATHSNVLAWRILWTEEPGGLWSIGSQRVRHDWVTNTFISHFQFSLVAQSCPTLQPHGLQHVRLPCPSPSPGACLNSCPLSRWCHPTVSSSVVPFSSCLQSFPVSGSFYNEWTLSIRWPKFWSFSFSMSLSNEYSGLISL